MFIIKALMYFFSCFIVSNVVCVKVGKIFYYFKTVHFSQVSPLLGILNQEQRASDYLLFDELM